jgi:hypothetical protein
MLSDPERAVKRGTGAGFVRAVRRKDAGRSLAATEPAPNVATSLVFRQTRIQSGVAAFSRVMAPAPTSPPMAAAARKAAQARPDEIFLRDPSSASSAA